MQELRRFAGDTPRTIWPIARLYEASRTSCVCDHAKVAWHEFDFEPATRNPANLFPEKPNNGPVDILRQRAEYRRTVEADSEKEAIEKAAKLFDIPPERQKLMSAGSGSSPSPGGNRRRCHRRLFWKDVGCRDKGDRKQPKLGVRRANEIREFLAGLDTHQK